MIGRIVRVFHDKGFGFIHAGTKDYFFHRNAITNKPWNEVQERDMVEFEDTYPQKGPRAENIEVK